MNPLDLMTIGFPIVIVILVFIGFYKVFVKKRNITPFYTPFDEITGQTEVAFHEEQEVLAEDEDQGDDKDKNKGKR
ncbi:DUF3951 domain-containing protein [Bacillus salitolerans]|uniref:DUF3951 domain-containing protein n=1 Tax=Bacillus salitolerans TaxID=1437434 RepID=A0ABW4LPL0_9BACI